ncbi:MAG: hypothetical protein ACFCAD_11150, partial [Pleurocapsa sp.]
LFAAFFVALGSEILWLALFTAINYISYFYNMRFRCITAYTPRKAWQATEIGFGRYSAPLWRLIYFLTLHIDSRFNQFF